MEKEALKRATRTVEQLNNYSESIEHINAIQEIHTGMSKVTIIGREIDEEDYKFLSENRDIVKKALIIYRRAYQSAIKVKRKELKEL